MDVHSTGAGLAAPPEQEPLVPRSELLIVGAYVLGASLWILASDEALTFITGDAEQTLALQTFKGLNFVATTAGLLYLVLRRSFMRRRQAEQHTHEAWQRFEFAARAATDAIWDWDLGTNLIWWSDGFQKLFGYPASEVEPTVDSWTNRLHPEDKDRAVSGLYHVVHTGGDNWSDEYRFRRKDGRYAFVYDRGFIIRDAAGRPVRMVGGMTDVTERTLARQRLESSRRQLRALSAKLESSREEERTRIAREIHDELGQLLTAIKMDLRGLEKTAARTDAATPPALADRIAAITQLADNAIVTVQNIAAELRPGILDNIGLAPALRHEAGRFQERTGIVCRLQLPSQPAEVSRDTATAVFRIFQEALTNVARHAHATTLDISLQEQGEQLVLEVADNGRGLPPDALDAPKSLGLLGMIERAGQLGGEVTFQSPAPGGTRVRLHLPRLGGNADCRQRL